jgi:hypothetical protein
MGKFTLSNSKTRASNGAPSSKSGIFYCGRLPAKSDFHTSSRGCSTGGRHPREQVLGILVTASARWVPLAGRRLIPKPRSRARHGLEHDTGLAPTPHVSRLPVRLLSTGREHAGRSTAELQAPAGGAGAGAGLMLKNAIVLRKTAAEGYGSLTETDLRSNAAMGRISWATAQACLGPFPSNERPVVRR